MFSANEYNYIMKVYSQLIASERSTSSVANCSINIGKIEYHFRSIVLTHAVSRNILDIKFAGPALLVILNDSFQACKTT